MAAAHRSGPTVDSEGAVQTEEHLSVVSEFTWTVNAQQRNHWDVFLSRDRYRPSILIVHIVGESQ